MKNLVTIVFLFISIIGCSSSTGSRYETKEESKSEVKIEESKTINEDFDITPYETEIDIDVPPLTTEKLPPDVWYQYGKSVIDSSKQITGTTNGYRVQVLSTDDIDEANLVRSEIYEIAKNKEVYIIFDPPFYKVKVGDFTTKDEAENLRFKLNQLGYTESKVVQETVNLFE